MKRVTIFLLLAIMALQTLAIAWLVFQVTSPKQVSTEALTKRLDAVEQTATLALSRASQTMTVDVPFEFRYRYSNGESVSTLPTETTTLGEFLTRLTAPPASNNPGELAAIIDDGLPLGIPLRDLLHGWADGKELERIAREVQPSERTPKLNKYLKGLK